MKKRFFAVCVFIWFLALSLAYAGVVMAAQTINIPAQNGGNLIQFVVYGQGEYFGASKFGDIYSAWTLGSQQMQSIRHAGDYWSSLIGNNAKNTTPVRINVGGVNQYINAWAGYDPKGVKNGYTEMARSIYTGADPDQPVALMGIGWTGDSRRSGYFGPLTVLPQNGDLRHLGAVVTHEIGHAMGMSASTGELGGGSGNYVFVAPDNMTNWTKHLYDSYGVAAYDATRVFAGDPYLPIAINSTDSDLSEADPNKFQVYQDASGNYSYIFFQGEETLKVLGQTVDADGVVDGGTVLGGAAGNPNNIAGVPINSYEGGEPEFSHIELGNGMMSHQNYRNYTGYMEAELAMLQDIGIDLDRKNFFGASIYGDGATVEIITDYTARNAAGTAYVPGAYNDTAMGVGLHIYGSGNTVTMNAEVLSTGFGGAGIRVDGTQNALTIAKGKKIHSNGDYGTGLMVAYGVGHEIVSQGDIQALGQNGVAARFDFGSNILGNLVEYRGSYIRAQWDDGDEQWDNGSLIADENDAAQVASFDVSGQLLGGDKAVYISDNALVSNINFMAGTSLAGDIVSDWKPDNSFVQYDINDGGNSIDDLLTNISFGYTADQNGQADLTTPDAEFALHYRGDITSQAYGGAGDFTASRGTFKVDFGGGEMTYNGRMQLATYAQQEDATLLSLVNSPSYTEIYADAITLDPASKAGAAVDGEYYYGARLPSRSVILRYNAAEDQNLGDALPEIIQSSGSFSRGFYDYTYGSLAWNSPAANILDLTAGLDSRENRERSGQLSVTAPMAALVNNPGTQTVTGHVNRTFARLKTQGHSGGGGGGSTGDGPYHYVPLTAPGGSQSPTIAPSGGDGTIYYGSGSTEVASTVWFAPSFNHSKSKRGLGYEVDTPSVSLGLDLLATDSFFLGLAGSWSAPDYDSKHADVEGDAFAGYLYGGVWLPAGLELGFFGAYGQTDYDQTRKVHGEKFKSSFDATNYGGGLSLARPFQVNKQFTVRPFVSYEYQRLEVDGYREKPGQYSLAFGDQEHDMHFLRAGAEASYNLTPATYLSGRLYYAGLYGDREAEVPVYFTGDVARNIHLTKGLAMDRHSGGAGLGLGHRLNERIEFGGDFNFLGGDKVKDYQFGLNLKVGF